MVSRAEQKNFLSQCWQTGHWRDGINTLLLPLRVPAYRFRKSLLRRRDAATVAAMLESPPDFNVEVRPLFSKRVAAFASIVPPQSVFTDVDRQLCGIYRLAGGRYHHVNPDAVQDLEDAEDRHAWDRLYWITRYSQGAAFGHARAGEGLSRDWLQWLRTQRKHPVTMTAYTIAERIASLCESMYWLGNDERFISSFKRQIWKDARHLAANIEYGLGLHNHLLNDARGLWLASAALAECEFAGAWEQQAFQIWDEFFPKLVLEDGTFGEQSSHYHVLLCRTALEYWLASRKAGHDLPAGFETRLRHMCGLANDLLRPDGTLPRFGDSSPDRMIEDLWGLAAAMHHYGLLDEPPRHQAVTPLTLYYCGAVPDLPQENAPCRRIYPQGGFAFLRSSTSRAELTVHGDPRARAFVHGDTGRGSFEIWWQGQVIVREPGSFFSSSDPKSRKYRSGMLQNVTCLNGLAPGISVEDQRNLADWYCQGSGTWKELLNQGIEFQCEGFRRLNSNTLLRRAWRFDPYGNLLLNEQVDGTARVCLESRLCLGDYSWGPLRWDKSSNSGALEANGSVRLEIQASSEISAAIEQGSFIPEYGIEKTGLVLTLRGLKQLPFCWQARWTFTAGN